MSRSPDARSLVRSHLGGVALLATCALLAACGGEPAPAPSNKDMVVQGGGGGGEKAVDGAGKEVEAEHVENTGDFDRFAFACCDTPQATAVVDAYVDLSEKLAADQADAVGPAVDALAKAAQAAEAADVTAAVAPVQGKDMAGVREGLAPLSVAVITYARAHKGGEQKLSSAYCPMAPGHWLQRGGDIRNPYYGAEMLACGTLEDVAEVTADEAP